MLFKQRRGLDMFILFILFTEYTNMTDGHDGQTSHDGIGRAYA